MICIQIKPSAIQEGLPVLSERISGSDPAKYWWTSAFWESFCHPQLQFDFTSCCQQKVIRSTIRREYPAFQKAPSTKKKNSSPNIPHRCERDCWQPDAFLKCIHANTNNIGLHVTASSAQTVADWQLKPEKTVPWTQHLIGFGCFVLKSFTSIFFKQIFKAAVYLWD